MSKLNPDLQYFHDGLLEVALSPTPKQCLVCAAPKQRCLNIRAAELPGGIKPSASILIYFCNETGTLRRVPSIGLTCGCYARFHRQIAHIKSKIGGKKES